MQVKPQEPKAVQIREMFSRIAPRYDLLNHLLSLNIDRHWRRVTVGLLAPVLARPEAKVLDVCCGTADLALALGRRARARIIGVDFSHPMLVTARRKAERHERNVGLAEGDALRLPFSESEFDAVTIAFGLRNLVDREAGLNELHRMLKPRGSVAILEFSQPAFPLFRQLFGLYFQFILPRIGGAISGSRPAYEYLHDTVQAFPSPASLVRMMQSTGFSEVHYRTLSGGIAALHLGIRA
ncbi:MAG: bifunctional demethylmenaquinone methyltransferase/2-methoxy-6-polyprenyl-1,4-benzoquinol methylase UbiE [Acidobacteria bacterium]|nr:bifunctional demethylmenaquinone methyltransferase/2-methoxy-6-polyprenyl-1,4-benzoquinol methylase UbiE [Acidobacteriota bacterium]